MRRWGVLGAACFLGGAVWGQSAPLTFWVGFEAKSWGADYPYALERPGEFLSDRALARRAADGIAVDSLDLPVAPALLDALEALPGVRVLHASKWLNAASVAVEDSTFDPAVLEAVEGVVEVRRMAPGNWVGRLPDAEAPAARSGAVLPPDTGRYGAGWAPLVQLNGAPLHAHGYRGEGVLVAVLDAGFERVDLLPCFGPARAAGRIVEGWDVAGSQAGLYAHHRHGTGVLGTMASFWPDSLIGTAPDATYILYRTENAATEYLLEEDQWAAAAEHADALGADVLTTSLGYTTFDDSTMNHSPSDLDGATARISRASAIAATRGLLVVNSAGNTGNTDWHRISAPADADGILAVGAVNAAGEHAPFSGFGPTADGRVKPEVMAHGWQAAYPTHDTLVKYGNGTSFSAPILAGLAACLMQAVPQATAAEVRAAIIASAHLAAAPNDSMGYGIPDFHRAWALLERQPAAAGPGAVRLFPNPGDGLVRWTAGWAPTRWEAWTVTGRLVAEGAAPVWGGATDVAGGWIDLRGMGLAAGAYVLKFSGPDASATATYLLSPAQ